MTTMTIICQRCGIESEIEVQGLTSDTPSSRIFRHLGHNPFSGHLHYQCPACEIVLLVEPLTATETFPLLDYHVKKMVGIFS